MEFGRKWKDLVIVSVMLVSLCWLMSALKAISIVAEALDRYTLSHLWQKCLVVCVSSKAEESGLLEGFCA